MKSPIFKTIYLMIPFVLPLGVALDLYLPSVPAMTSAFSCDTAKIQLTLSLFLYCFGLGQLFVGPMADHFGRYKVLLASLILFTLGSMICLCSNTLSLLLIGRALQAIGACGSQVVSMAMVRDQYEGKDATIIFTTLKGAMSIAPIAAPVLGAFLQVYYGWRANFLVLSIYGLGIFLLAKLCIKETLPFKTPQRRLNFFTIIHPYSVVLKNTRYLYFCACAMSSQAAMFGYFSLSPRYYVNEFGLSEQVFALLFSANACAFLLTGAIAGKFIYHWGFRKSTMIAAFLLLLSGSSMFLGHYFYTHPYVLFLPNLIASSSAALMLGASASGAMLCFKQNAGCASSMFGCIEFIGGGMIGTLAIIGGGTSVIPLAISLTILGSAILAINLCFAKTIDELALA